jgi:hypothetical protein
MTTSLIRNSRDCLPYWPYLTGNPDLLITGDPLFYTNLLATLVMFRLNSASLTFGTTDEGNQLRCRQKLTRAKFSFKCTPKNPMPIHRWESYLRQVKAMVVDHFVRSIRHQSKNLPKHYEVLFTGSEIELSQVQRDKRKLGTMCHALIRTRAMTRSSTRSLERTQLAQRDRTQEGTDFGWIERRLNGNDIWLLFDQHSVKYFSGLSEK